MSDFSGIVKGGLTAATVFAGAAQAQEAPVTAMLRTFSPEHPGSMTLEAKEVDGLSACLAWADWAYVVADDKYLGDTMGHLICSVPGQPDVYFNNRADGEGFVAKPPESNEVTEAISPVEGALTLRLVQADGRSQPSVKVVWDNIAEATLHGAFLTRWPLDVSGKIEADGEVFTCTEAQCWSGNDFD